MTPPLKPANRVVRIVHDGIVARLIQAIQPQLTIPTTQIP